MQVRRMVGGGAFVLAALALGGCATPGYSPSRVESELVKAGTTPAQARCVTSGLSAKYDENQLGSHAQPKSPELVFTRSLLAKCGINLPLVPLPS